MLEAQEQIKFFDPFAENGEEAFDSVAAHEQITARYLSGEVEHDYTADRFVSDTQALILDAQFVGKFEQAQMIAMRMHQMCGEDHGLRQSLSANSSFSEMLGLKSHDGHDHSASHDEHTKKDNDDWEAGPDGKRRKKQSRGWLSLAALSIKRSIFSFK